MGIKTTIRTEHSNACHSPNLSGGSTIGEIFEGEMLIRQLFKYFCKVFLNFQVLFTSIVNPENNFKKYFEG